MKKIILLIVLILSTSSVFPQFDYKPSKTGGSIHLTGEDYITGEDGVARMSINIWGHVKYPGSYLVYDEIDILTCLSMAGGPLKGAKLSKVIVVSKDGFIKTINLDKDNISDFQLKPHDTIKVDEKISHVILTKTSIISVMLQLTNVILTAFN